MQPTVTPTALASVFTHAIEEARARVGDPLARIVFVTPASTNGIQIRTVLGVSGKPFIHVDFLTPGRIVAALGELPMLMLGQLPEPGGWTGSMLATLLPRLAAEGALDPYGEVLNEPGWRRPIEGALGELQGAGVRPGTLRALADDSPQGRRFALLATLLEEVSEARAQSGIFARGDVERAALRHLQEPTAHPLDDVRAVIVVGDGLIPPGEFEVMRRWLALHDVTRIDLPPLCNLEPAQNGLRMAAGVCHVLRAEPPETRLGHLARRLFTDDKAGATVADDSVTLVSTPDEIREMAEVVRTVQRAMVDGVALDRIAIVLPDAEQAHVLEAALERASIPATWLTGPSLARTPAASFLTLALDVANGEQGAARWYDLLAQPGLLGMGWRGRGRWRGVLAQCHGRTGEALIEQLEGIVAAHGPHEDGSPSLTAIAAGQLVEHLRTLMGRMDQLPELATLGEHGRAWQSLLETTWVQHKKQLPQDAQHVVNLLKGWGPGPRLSRKVAAGLLRESLAQTQFLRGQLNAATVRVLPPMATLGAEFDLVCVAGMTEGRFPRAHRENVLLTDAMIARLCAHGEPLVEAAERERVEVRRLAAVLAACRGRLWMATPKFEMLQSRPCQPSSLLLEVASTLEGRRIRYEELAALQVRQGSRSRPVPQSPDAALGRGEFLLARLVQDPARALPSLATEAVARRLLQLHRSVDRLRLGGLPDAWTGLVPHDAMPIDVMTELALDARSLALWALDPSAFFFEWVLGVRDPRSFGGGGMQHWTLTSAVLTAAREAMDGPQEEFDARFGAAWTREVDAFVDHGTVDPTTRHVWERLGHRALGRLVEAQGGGLPGVTASAERASLHPTLPILLTGDFGWASGDELSAWRQGKTALNKVDSDKFAFQMVAQARAMQASGTPIEQLRVASPIHGPVTIEVARVSDAFDAVLGHSHSRMTAGWWPMSGGSRFGLSREPAWNTTTAAEPLARLERRP